MVLADSMGYGWLPGSQLDSADIVHREKTVAAIVCGGSLVWLIIYLS